MTTPTLTLRRAEDRGHANHGWLDTHFSFSFADYFDPQHMGFGPLRVLNEDRIAGGGGFPMHPHRDMEILTWVLSGALEHRDSMGNGSVVRPGELQRMSAGTGVRHSEKNASETDPLHLLQIWLLPEHEGLEPGYEQKGFEDQMLRGRFALLASRDGREGSVTIHQDASLMVARLAAGESAHHDVASRRRVWLHVARGSVTTDGTALAAGDAVGIENPSRVEVTATEDAEVLLFDMA